MSRTFSTSISQRDVIHAHGHSGSNQSSTGVFVVSVTRSISCQRRLSVPDTWSGIAASPRRAPRGMRRRSDAQPADPSAV